MVCSILVVITIVAVAGTGAVLGAALVTAEVAGAVVPGGSVLGVLAATEVVTVAVL